VPLGRETKYRKRSAILGGARVSQEDILDTMTAIATRAAYGQRFRNVCSHRSHQLSNWGWTAGFGFFAVGKGRALMTTVCGTGVGGTIGVAVPVVVDDGVAVPETIVDGVLEPTPTPRSVSPRLGKSFISTSEYSGNASMKRRCLIFQA